MYENKNAWKPMPIVALTAMSLSDDRDRALAVGYVGADPLWIIERFRFSPHGMWPFFAASNAGKKSKSNLR